MLNNSEELSQSTWMDGTIIYTLFYSISKEVRVAKDEVIRPVRSAPLYEENFLRFKVIRDPVMHEVNGRRIAFDIKIFENSNLRPATSAMAEMISLL